MVAGEPFAPPGQVIPSVSLRPDITLQINVCAGDLAYLDLTVPALVATHRADVREVLIVADACRPQSTPVLHAPSRFPAADFATKIARLREICARWLNSGLVDRVDWLEPWSPRTPELNRRYLGRATPWTHDHLGHALTAYFAGWDSPRTRYVLHFDADVLLYQQPGYSWLRSAVVAMEAAPLVLASSPRLSPPKSGPDSPLVDQNIAGNGWQPMWPLVPSVAGWTSPWITTRCHLLDRERLARYLPLAPRGRPIAETFDEVLNRLLFPLYNVRAWIADPARPPTRLSERIASRIARRMIPPFPLPPEVLLHENALQSGFECLYLGDPRAWYIHPDSKPPEVLSLFPLLVASVKSGRVPASQLGFTGIRPGDWAGFGNA